MVLLNPLPVLLWVQWLFLVPQVASAQRQAPAPAGLGEPISDRDRVYTGDQSSNTITVVKPSTNEVLGTIALGDSRLSGVIGPQYIKAVNAHGMGYSRDGKHIVVLSVTTNTVTVVRCADNSIVSQTFVDRNAHEAFFAADNRTIWVGTRGVDRITLVDGIDGGVVGHIPTYGGPSKVLFSPDGSTAYANHIRSPSLSVIDVESQTIVHNITGLADTFSSDMMLSADGRRLWVAHKMAGTVTVINTDDYSIVGVLETGAETNHPNFVEVNGTTYGYVTVAATNETKVYTQPDPASPPDFLTSIRATGIEPHGLWPSADNTRMYIVNEHTDTVDVVDTASLSVVDTLDVGQEGQAIVYVSNAVPEGDGLLNLGTQGLRGRAKNKLLSVEGGKEDAAALITVRDQNGLDMFQIIGRKLLLNTTYVAAAECTSCGGVEVPLLEFNATMPTMDGCGTAPQVLAFFKFEDVYDFDSLRVYEK
ncbi:nitrous oxide reductase [Lineolata rhizophorae]|uniref:Nitrous oxide reductase n=1 Tax=Lineolata rhizophorae TaxID=578093 RepID=A0A6A6P6C4_9PEZI|nr:nitrous oxide reductase [Lineolata rhizophorae]